MKLIDHSINLQLSNLDFFSPSAHPRNPVIGLEQLNVLTELISKIQEKKQRFTIGPDDGRPGKIKHLEFIQLDDKHKKRITSRRWINSTVNNYKNSVYFKAAFGNGCFIIKFKKKTLNPDQDQETPMLPFNAILLPATSPPEELTANC